MHHLVPLIDNSATESRDTCPPPLLLHTVVGSSYSSRLKTRSMLFGFSLVAVIVLLSTASADAGDESSNPGDRQNIDHPFA